MQAFIKLSLTDKPVLDATWDFENSRWNVLRAKLDSSKTVLDSESTARVYEGHSELKKLLAVLVTFLGSVDATVSFDELIVEECKDLSSKTQLLDMFERILANNLDDSDVVEISPSSKKRKLDDTGVYTVSNQLEDSLVVTKVSSKKTYMTALRRLAQLLRVNIRTPQDIVDNLDNIRSLPNALEFVTMIVSAITQHVGEERAQEIRDSLYATKDSSKLTWEEILAKYQQLKQSLRYVFENDMYTIITKTQQLLDFVLLGHFVLMEPRQCSDYANLKVRNITDEDKGLFSYMSSSSTYVIRRKTTRRLPTTSENTPACHISWSEKVLTIPEELQTYMKHWFVFNRTDWLFVNKRNEPMTKDQLIARLKVILDNPNMGVQSIVEAYKIAHPSLDKLEEDTVEQERRMKEVFSSKGEEETRKAAERIFGVAFKKVRPDWLRTYTTGSPLELDNYNEELRVAFEFNGKQHYEFVNYYHSKDAYKYQRARDEIKALYCDKNNVKLFTIPYTVPIEKIEDDMRRQLLEAKFEPYLLTLVNTAAPEVVS